MIFYCVCWYGVVFKLCSLHLLPTVCSYTKLEVGDFGAQNCQQGTESRTRSHLASERIDKSLADLLPFQNCITVKGLKIFALL